MPRHPKPLPLDIDRDAYDVELIECAEQRHALNVLITEYDWLRIQELAELRNASVSDLVRDAIDSALSNVDEESHLRDVAMSQLRHELELRRSRAQITSSPPVEKSRRRRAG